MDKPPSPETSDREVWHPRQRYLKLALHRWEMGQVLHPSQFRAQEEALLEQLGLRVQLAGLPSYGVALLHWSEAQVASGDLAISAFTVVLPSGLLLSYPGNAVLTTRNLSLPAKAAGPVSIYLHLRAERRPDDARDLSQYLDDGPELKRTIHQVEISAEPGLENEQRRFKLAELRFAGGAWSLAPYVPPLLALGAGTTPFLQQPLAAVVSAIDELEHELVKRAADSVAGTEQLSEVRRVLTAVYRVRAVLADHGYGAPTQTVALHPYHLFTALRDFYLEAVVLQGRAQEAWPLRYQHDDLGACFAQLARGLERGMKVPSAVSARLPFHRDEYWFVTQPFPEELCAATEVFLLLEREPASAGPAQPAATALDDIKLASPLRADEVYTKALEGVPRRAVPALTFSRTFGDRATVLALDSGSREWRQAVAERALCFAVLPGLEEFTASLFWQSPAHG